MYTEFTGMPLGKGHSYVSGVDEQAELDIQWPQWRKFVEETGCLPPLDDRTVETAVRMNLAPKWIIDGVETVRRFGGEAWGVEDDLEELPFGSIVVKPRWNAYGLAHGARIWEWNSASDEGTGPHPVLNSDEMCQSKYTGCHLSIDFALRSGLVLWGIQATGFPTLGRFGRFCQWTVEAGAPSVFNGAVWPRHFTDAMEIALPRYTGVVNAELIEGKVIEVHFRPSLEFFPLYGEVAVRALMEAACGSASIGPPPVSGGVMQVIARGTRRVKVRREFGEWSWRRSLIYNL